jgi:hypothetical protein
VVADAVAYAAGIGRVDVRYLGGASVALFVWGIVWMWRVGRSGPSLLNALAETAVFLAFPAGPVVWSGLRRHHRTRGG